MSAFAKAGRVLRSEQPPQGPRFPVEGRDPAEYLEAAKQVSAFRLTLRAFKCKCLCSSA